MTLRSWEEIGRLFEAALEQPLEKRTAWLKQSCRDDPELLHELTTLLAAHERTGGALDTSALELLPELWNEEDAASAARAGVGDRIGPWRLLEVIAEGGMSTVWLAEYADRRTERRVALKIMRPGFGDAAFVRHFLREQAVLARLEHPGIARLYEAGASDEGRPWFAMEYVRGEPIDEYCRRHGLEIDARLRLFRQVCTALHYAHRNLVLHLDIKPANVLVTEEGEVKLLDFGISRLLAGDDEQRRNELTRRFGDWLTPEYAAPEQLRGKPLSTATDVYALGGLLYRLLTGMQPFPVVNRSPGEIERLVCQTMPTAPSAMLARNAEASSRPRRRWHEHRLLKGDLDMIVLTALRKEPERRYASAYSFAEDVRRHLEGKPIKARTDTFAYRAGKFSGRHRLGLAASAVVVALVVGLSIFYVTQIVAQRNTARRQATRERAVSDFLVSLFEDTDSYTRANTRGLTLDTVLERGTQRLNKQLRNDPRAHAQLMGIIGRVYADLGHYAEAEPLLRTAYSQSIQAWGPGNLETAKIATSLAFVLVRRGDYAKAAPLFQGALAVYRRAGPAYRVKAAHLLGAYAGLLRLSGRPRRAEKAARKSLAALAAAGETLAPFDHYTLTLALVDQGELDEAVAIARPALKNQRAHDGPDNTDVAATMTALALALQLQGKLPEAERWFRKGLAIRRKLLPPGHPEIADSLVRLAWVLAQEGKGVEAEKLGRQGAKLLHATLPPDHWKVAAADGIVGVALAVQGRFVEAEKPLLHAHDVFLAHFGSKDWRTVSSVQALYKLYMVWGKPDKARHYQEILSHAHVGQTRAKIHTKP